MTKYNYNNCGVFDDQEQEDTLPRAIYVVGEPTREDIDGLLEMMSDQDMRSVYYLLTGFLTKRGFELEVVDEEVADEERD